ncbi:dipeptide/oligopeptide/nickel ABC transporter permease/ATP-binding protein [Nocardiopsis tropica]|uniref:Dipeptide/oligopeptide/nickel ABC transporter permease/ATP-binding protein n=1 Tax=Nocardiopsis tropica TaxID=109330 RepID=A0ABU7L0D8_9ACTN|nr:dipeptide/oligopeptide/nickel ABC transporter permease/ATP-binding protein [Nocardiopsis umidischolae]MEE2054978.1 dipeptide/oligopeptide/nickel ABC transporter permease/ATP-binding protein [Nocardiopsis umidischolae]
MPEPATRPTRTGRAVSGRVLPAAALAALVVYAVAVPWWAGPQTADFSQALLGPGPAHWFGTDHSGHDLFVRAAEGLRVSLAIALACAVTATVLGVAVGAAAASAGGRVDMLLMRVTDGVNALPHLLLGVVVVALYPGSPWAVIASVSLTHWPQIARIVRAEALSVRSAEYVEAAYLWGSTRRSVLLRHLLPAALPQAAVGLVMLLPHAVWHESTLSFLGLGLPPDEASLGTLLEVARGDVFTGAWWTLAAPAGVLVATTLATAGLSGVLGPGPRRARGPGVRRGTAAPTVAGAAAPGAIARDVPAAEPPEPEVRVRGLTLRLPTDDGRLVHAATGVDLDLHAGRLTALVGESGCGKSTLASALCGLLPPGTRTAGSVRVGGREVPADDERAWRGLRGSVVGLAGQAGAATFTPVRRLGPQLAEVAASLGSPTPVPELLARVGLEESAADKYPHELSGGMAARAVLAAALAGDPAVLVADEPTAGLDPDLAGQVLRLLRGAAGRGTAVLVITHDLQALDTAGAADAVAVMYAGRIVEHGPAERVLTAPEHPYTGALLAALPGRGLRPLPGLPPELTDPPGEGSFAERRGGTDVAGR